MCIVLHEVSASARSGPVDSRLLTNRPTEPVVQAVELSEGDTSHAGYRYLFPCKKIVAKPRSCNCQPLSEDTSEMKTSKKPFFVDKVHKMNYILQIKTTEERPWQMTFLGLQKLLPMQK